MKFKDHNGKEIDTDLFNDIKSFAYEELAGFHNRLKPLGLSFVGAVKYDHVNVVGSMFLQKGMDFCDLIQFIDQQVQETTNGDFGIQVIKLK